MKKETLKRRKNDDGFTLLELLVTVAIILIIAAIAIPKYLQAKVAANETAAVGDLRSLMNAESVYNARFGASASVLSQLTVADTPTDCTGSGILDPVQWAGATPQMSGYNITFTAPGADNPADPSQTIAGCVMFHTWSAVAAPISASTGSRQFYIDDSGTVHYATAGAPTNASPVLGQ